MKKKLKSILLKLDNTEEFFSNILLFSLVVLLLFQVVSRFIFHTGMASSEEFSRFIFVLMALWATSFIAKARGHIRITAFMDLFPKKYQIIFKVIADLIFFIFNCFVIYFGILFTIQNFLFPRISPISRINMAWIYLFIPITFFTTNIRIMLYWFCGDIKVTHSIKKEI